MTIFMLLSLCGCINRERSRYDQMESIHIAYKIHFTDKIYEVDRSTMTRRERYQEPHELDIRLPSSEDKFVETVDFLISNNLDFHGLEVSPSPSSGQDSGTLEPRFTVQLKLRNGSVKTCQIGLVDGQDKERCSRILKYLNKMMPEP